MSAPSLQSNLDMKLISYEILRSAGGLYSSPRTTAPLGIGSHSRASMYSMAVRPESLLADLPNHPTFYASQNG